MVVKKLKQWHYFDKVYRRWVVMFVGSFKDFHNEMRIIGYEDAELLYDANGYTIALNQHNNKNGNDAYVIWLKAWDLDTLVHEITHMCMFAFKDLNIGITLETGEPFAHYMEHWYRELQALRKKYPNGNKPHQAKR